MDAKGKGSEHRQERDPRAWQRPDPDSVPPRPKKRDPLPYIGLALGAVFLLGNILALVLFLSKFPRDSRPAQSFETPWVTIDAIETTSRMPAPAESNSGTTVTSTSSQPEKTFEIVVDEVAIQLPADWKRTEERQDGHTSYFLYKSGVVGDSTEGYGHLVVIEQAVPPRPEYFEAGYDEFIRGFNDGLNFKVTDERRALIEKIAARTMTIEGYFDRFTLYGKAAVFFTSKHLIFLTFAHPDETRLYGMEELLRDALPFQFFGAPEEDLRSIRLSFKHFRSR